MESTTTTTYPWNSGADDVARSCSSATHCVWCDLCDDLGWLAGCRLQEPSSTARERYMPRQCTIYALAICFEIMKDRQSLRRDDIRKTEALKRWRRDMDTAVVG